MNKKMYQRQNKSKSSGKTLTGILIGLILGAVVIAVLLWFLNQNRVPTEPQKTPQNTDVEIMIPNQAVLPGTQEISESMAPAVSMVEESVSGWIEVDKNLDETEKSTGLSPVILPSTQSETTQSSLTDKKPKDQPEPKKEPEVKKPTEHNTPAVQEKAKPTVKPSAEQILEHGSVEKAHAAAKNEASAKEAQPKKEAAVKKAASAKVQAGSYGKTEQAEAQRAKLALLGIASHIETAQVNGKTVHRVRTETLSGEKAAQVRQKLQQQGIDAITVSGQ